MPTRSLTLRKDCRVRIFENKMLRKVLNLRKENGGEYYIIRSFINFSLACIVKMIESSRIGWIGYVSHLGN
jgi:hypothetical protein